MRWLDGYRARLRLLFRRNEADSRADDEFRFHIEMEAERLVREEGLDPGEAKRRAAVAFGGVQQHKEDLRDARGFAWFSGLSLDARLGSRMLVKYPGLTLVGGIGMAVAIAFGAIFSASAAVVNSTLPFEEGERVVAIENWDAEINNQERRILHDFAAWRDELGSVEELGAYRTIRRNLIIPGALSEPRPIAEMSASGFRLARVPAFLGRHIVADDEREGAPAVLVIGHELWQSHFDGDSAVVGREVRVGSAVHTVVGVMPEGFAFPLNHQAWVPLRINAAAYGLREGPSLNVFGRLASGSTLAQAQAELTMTGQQRAAAFPETHAQLRPRVVAYTAQMFDNMVGYEIPVMRFLVTLLLVVICANVAILVYARTATRRSEITVRSALGASRRRIVTQLFVEALVLSAGAAAVGTGIAALVLAYLDAWLSGPAARFGGLPFWMEFRLSSGTVFFVLALMLLGAVIVGVVPALKATGGRLQPRLNALGGGTGMRMGRTWTFLIVAQVAFVVAALPIALYSGWDFARHGMADPGFAAEEFVAASLIMDREASPAEEREAEDRAFDLRYAAAHAELTRRLEVEPAVAGVTFTAHLPGMEPTVRVEVEGMPLDTLARAPAGSASGHSARSGAVDLEFFETFDVPVLGGRAFNPADIGAGSAPVIVNRAFVQQILGGGVALERRIRYVSGYRSGGVMRDPDNVEMEQWYEIVGVVGDLPGNPMEPGATQAMLYHPAAHGDLYPPVLALRVREGSAALFAGRLREITTAIDPTLRLFDLRPLDEILGQWQGGMRLAALAILLVTLSVLLLSSAGIYALMSFTVAQRRKEIGIRAALGADRRHILMGVFSRAAGQLAAGAALGLVAAALIDRLAGGLIVGGDGMIVLPAVAVLMVVIGLLGALGPARSGLRIQPTEALKGDV